MRYKRLTARVPRRIGWVNAAWIEVEFRVEEGSFHNSFVERTSRWRPLDELEFLWAIPRSAVLIKKKQARFTDPHK